MREELSTEWKELRQRLGNLICRIDGQVASLGAEEKRMEERRDESYVNGVRNFHESIKAIIAKETIGGMGPEALDEFFGSAHINRIIYETDPKEIMEKVKEWKIEQEHVQEEDNKFRVGDEVIITTEVPRKTENGMTKEIRESKGIITGLEDNIVWICRPDNNNSHFMYYSYFWTEMESIKKTGRHFDSIPFSYGQEKSDAE